MRLDVRHRAIKLQGEDLYFTNFTYDPACYYFLYIGELKTYGLNQFVREALQKRLPDRQVRFAAIIPDVCVQYYYDEVIVINPLGGDGAAPVGTVSPPGLRTSCRQAIGPFMTAVSASATIRQLIAAILENQPELYLSMFESVVEMTMDAIDRVSILGPDKAIARR